MSRAPTLPHAAAPDPARTDVLPYASPNMPAPRITYRGAVTTLAVGGGLLVLAVALLTVAWAIFRDYAERGGGYAASALEALGVFVCILAGLSFLIGLITLFLGLKGVRQRELA
jgi:hypothetical protein